MIEYKLIRKKIKNVYICIKDGQVIVKVPLKFSQAKIEELLKEKSEWINKKLNAVKKEKLVNLEERYVYILGKRVEIKYLYSKYKRIDVTLDENSCVILLPKEAKINDEATNKNIQRKMDVALKELAEKYVIICMNKYIKLTNLKPEKIAIRKFKSIWGNCSSKRVIKINQKLIHYDIKQIEYVCLHELTHLKYMNHQKEFWSHVEKYMPSYKEIAKSLKA